MVDVVGAVGHRGWVGWVERMKWICFGGAAAGSLSLFPSVCVFRSHPEVSHPLWLPAFSPDCTKIVAITPD
jgi:hypothetical protein